jgi:hypothetical protein
MVPGSRVEIPRLAAACLDPFRPSASESGAFTLARNLLLAGIGDPADWRESNSDPVNFMRRILMKEVAQFNKHTIDSVAHTSIVFGMHPTTGGWRAREEVNTNRVFLTVEATHISVVYLRATFDLLGRIDGAPAGDLLPDAARFALRVGPLEIGAKEVIVAEGPGHERDTYLVLSETGLENQLRLRRLRFVDLNRDEIVPVPLKTRFTGLASLWLPRTVLNADFVVSMPKVKTHHWAGVTLSLKNMFGIMPSAVYGWPKNVLHWKGIDRSILDINAGVPVHFVIADGIITDGRQRPTARIRPTSWTHRSVG